MENRETEAHSNGRVLDDDVLEDEQFQIALKDAQTFETTSHVQNRDRAVGTRIAGKLAREYGDTGFTPKGGKIMLNYEGAAGQSFGAFCIDGIDMNLIGQANDYVGKSMNGGTISIKPSSTFNEKSNCNVIIGNTCVYGGTGGNLFAAGRAGERLAVRNSGCRVVVEGTGDHCCEYMTGGRVVVLGGVGRNLGAGMTGGIAYIMDDSEDVQKRINGDVRIQRVQTDAAKEELKQLISDFQKSTGSDLAFKVLDNFDYHLSKFWQVIPPAEDNTNLTHADIVSEIDMESPVVAEKSETITGSTSPRGKVPAVTMSAADQITGNESKNANIFEIKTMEQ